MHHHNTIPILSNPPNSIESAQKWPGRDVQPQLLISLLQLASPPAKTATEHLVPPHKEGTAHNVGYDAYTAVMPETPESRRE